MPEQCIQHGGVRRCFMIHKPIGTPNNAPLVVDMHGYSVHVYTNLVSGVMHGGGHYDFSRWKTIANQEKFIVVRTKGLIQTQQLRGPPHSLGVTLKQS